MAEPDRIKWVGDERDSIDYLARQYGPLQSTPPPPATPRQIAMDAVIERHQGEYETVHNGSGRSEELPSDLMRRHALNGGVSRKNIRTQSQAGD